MPGNPQKNMLNDLFTKSSKKQKTPLGKEQVAVLLHFCFCNAQDLFEEAELLRRHKKYARAFYLYTVALEELAKIPIALNGLFLPPEDTKAWEGFWKTFNSHGPKQYVAKMYGQQFVKTLDRERYERFYKSQIPSGIPLNDMKLASLYVDCYDGHPLRPTKLFGAKGSVASIAKIARARIKSFADLHSTIGKSIRFVEQSLKHSVQVDGKDFGQIVIDNFRQRA
jgi:AbiV family abortive infection protein